MDLREAIEERRSIRKFFPKPVEMEKIGEVIHAGMAAPSIGDLQPWNYIVVTKAQKLQDLADACPYERWLYQAPLVIVVCALSDRAESYYPGKGRLWASHSCAAAAENMSLAALDLGLASCWVTSFETYKIKDVLHIPDGIEPEIILALGYPDEEPERKRHPPLHTFVFFNDFGASNTDVALFKRDYGEFVRDRLDDAKTRAAYETAPRGGVRMAIDEAKTKFSALFRKKKAAQAAAHKDHEKTHHSHEHASSSHAHKDHGHAHEHKKDHSGHKH